METIEKRVQEMTEWFASPRFKGIVRLYSPRQVVEQRGTIRHRLPGRPQRRRRLLSGACANCSNRASRSRPSALTRPARL